MNNKASFFSWISKPLSAVVGKFEKDYFWKTQYAELMNSTKTGQIFMIQLPKYSAFQVQYLSVYHESTCHESWGKLIIEIYLIVSA